MVSTEGLHEENLVQIFRHLPPSTPWHWLSCKLVSKEWSRLADLALQHLYLRGGRRLPIALLLPRIPNFSHLRSLSVIPQALSEITEEFFLLISTSCPQLETIDIHHQCPLNLTATALSPLFSNCSNLTSLSLGSAMSTITLPQSLGQLTKLQHLGLHCDVLRAPHSFASLCDLEFMYVSGPVVEMAPGFPWGLPALQKLTIPYGALNLDASQGALSSLRELCLISSGEDSKMSVESAFVEGLEKLEKLEVDIYGKAELATLLELPWSDLKNVDYFSVKTAYVLSNDLKLLGGWGGLRSLKIACEALELEFDVEEGEDSEDEDFEPENGMIEEALESMKLCLAQITQLDMEVHSLEAWRGALPFVNLTKLRLEGVGNHQMFSEIFHGLDKLVELYVGHMYGLTKLWSVDSLVNLGSLSIVKCRKLTRMPDFRKLTKLKSLILIHNDVLEVTTMSRSEYDASVASLEVLHIEACPMILTKDLIWL